MFTGRYELDIWTKTVWGEARNQSFHGKIAVAWVIQNRRNDDRWPNSIAKVCLQDKQFSCWNGGDPNLHRIASLDPKDYVYLECLHAVLTVLLNKEVDPTNGANHYAVVGLDPYWSKGEQSVALIGDHEFWKL